MRLDFHSGLLCAGLFCALAGTPPAPAQDGVALRARHLSLQDRLVARQPGLPLHLESREEARRLTGDVWARLNQPFAAVAPTLNRIDRWCDILILHLNVKQCRAASPPEGNRLRVDVVRRFDQPLEDAYEFDFAYSVAAATPDYLQLVLSSEQGPAGTSDYRMVLELAAIDADRAFLHLSYSYAYTAAAHMGMQAWLATFGGSEVGFSVLGATRGGEPVYIDGLRGLVERNAMRYWLALEAYLGVLGASPSTQESQRLRAWYAGLERYPRQLVELHRGQYLDMKGRELRRQATAASPTGVVPVAGYRY